jgi:hypothetical protein
VERIVTDAWDGRRSVNRLFICMSLSLMYANALIRQRFFNSTLQRFGDAHLSAQKGF